MKPIGLEDVSKATVIMISALLKHSSNGFDAVFVRVTKK